MYDDLAKTQHRGFLELLVVRCVIPTVLTSFVMQCRALSSPTDGLAYSEPDCFCRCFFEWSVPMRGFSPVVSVSAHAALGAALLLGTTSSARTKPIASTPFPVVFPEPTPSPDRGIALPSPDIPPAPDLPVIEFTSPVLQTGATSHPGFPTYVPSTVTAGGVQPSAGWGGVLGEEGPEVLTGPLPAYPDLLRQAGIQGQVVLEARVDSSGLVERASILVVSATNPGFVEPARQALLATLFRPARVNGRAVSMLVRVPFAFSIRGGTGRAR